jgi:hypothetical protein
MNFSQTENQDLIRATVADFAKKRNIASLQDLG